MRVAVVGGGIGGLAAASLIARAGHELTLFEASSTLGGKCRRIVLDGQGVDTGPSLLTFPGVFTELARRWNGLRADERDAERIMKLRLERLPHLATHVFEDEELTLPVPRGHPRYLAWRAYARAHEDLGPTLERMLYQAPRALATSWPAMRLAMRYRGHTTAAGYLRARHAPSPLRRAIAIHALDSGVGPDQALPFFASLPAVLACDGVYTPLGGMYELVRALARLARAGGADLRTGTSVERIGERALRVHGSTHRFDRVVSNVDPRRLAQLLGSPPPPPRQSTCSGVGVYATLEGALPAGLDGHTVVMPDDDGAMHAALREGAEPETTMVLLHGVPARPGRRATLSVLLTAPANGRRYDLDSAFVRRELSRVQRRLRLRAPLAERFHRHAMLDPGYFARGGAPGGALYGDVRGLLRSGPLHDFPHRDPERPWLYRVGASVHPGGGIPAVLGGAMITVAQLLERAPVRHVMRRTNSEAVSP